MTEFQIMEAIQLELGQYTDVLVLFRNNVGLAERGQRKIRFGVGGPGGADLIGVRCRDGRFLAVEIKTPKGRQTDEQVRFQQLVTRTGGIYVVLRSVEEARQWLATIST